MTSPSRLGSIAAALAALSTTTCSVSAESNDKYFDFEDFNNGSYSKINHFTESEKAALEAFQFLQNNREKILTSPMHFLETQGYGFVSSRVNHEIIKAFAKVPLLAYTSLDVNFASGASPAVSLNSLLALKTFKDSNSDLLNGIIFSQHRFEKAFKKDGSTLNTGLGARFKVNSSTVFGLNGFWDYRIMTAYSSHSRFGLGTEIWHKNFDLVNNWYFAGTKTKTILDNSSETIYERVVPGWDVKLTYRFAADSKLSTYVRGFRWDYHSTSDNSGIALGINWQALPALNINLDVSNEIPSHITYSKSNLGDNIYARIGFSWTLNKVKDTSMDAQIPNTKSLMTRPVDRKYQVKLERYSVSKASSNSSSNPSSFNVKVSASGN